MKTSIVTLLITFCFYLSVYAQAPQDKATELKEQALSSLKQKDYIKARYSNYAVIWNNSSGQANRSKTKSFMTYAFPSARNGCRCTFH